MLARQSTLSSMVVIGGQDQVLVISANELQKRMQANEIVLYPAAFRVKLIES
jgi:hypothetical protein